MRSIKQKITIVARIIARQRAYDPDYLEPGDLPRIDGHKPNGDPAHYIWREFIKDAKEIINGIS